MSSSHFGDHGPQSVLVAQVVETPHDLARQRRARRMALLSCTLAAVSLVASVGVLIALVIGAMRASLGAPLVLVGTFILIGLVACAWTLISQKDSRGVFGPALAGVIMSFSSVAILLFGFALRSMADSFQAASRAVVQQPRMEPVRPGQPLPVPFQGAKRRPRRPEPRPLQIVPLSISGETISTDLAPVQEVQDGLSIHSLKLIDAMPPVALQWSADGKHAFVLTRKGLTRMSVPEFVCDRFATIDDGKDLQWSPQGLLVLDNWGNIYVFDPATLNIVRRIEDEECHRLLGARDHPVVLAVNRQFVRVLDLQQKQAFRTITEAQLAAQTKGSPLGFHHPYRSPDGRMIAFVDRGVHLFQLAGNDLKHTGSVALPAGSKLQSAQFSDDSQSLFAAYSTKQNDEEEQLTFELFDVSQPGLPSRKLVVDEKHPWAAVAGDLQHFFAGTDNRGLLILDAHGVEQSRPWLSVSPRRTSFAPGGRGLLFDSASNFYWLEYVRPKTISLPAAAPLPASVPGEQSLKVEKIEVFRVPAVELGSLVASHNAQPVWSSDGKVLYILDEQQRAARVERADWRVTHVVDAKLDGDARMIMTAAGLTITSQNKGSIWVLDPADLSPRAHYVSRGRHWYSGAPSSPYLAVLGQNGTSWSLCDLRDGRITWRMPVGQLRTLLEERGAEIGKEVFPSEAHMSADGKYLCCLCGQALVRLLIEGDSCTLDTWTAPGKNPHSLTLDHDSKHLAVQIQEPIGNSSLTTATWLIYATDDFEKPLHTFVAPPRNVRLAFHGSLPAVFVTSDDRPIDLLDFSGQQMAGQEAVMGDLRHVVFCLAPRPQSGEILFRLPQGWFALDFGGGMKGKEE